LESGEAHGEDAVAITAELPVSDSQMRTAVRYSDAFTNEIDRRIALNTVDADEGEAAWRREHSGQW
jgi:hypothetical protein